MNLLYLTAQPNIPHLERLVADDAMVKVACAIEPTVDLYLTPGVEVVERWEDHVDWAEVAVVDTPELGHLYHPLVARLPVFGIGDQVDKLSLRQGDVWYRLGVPAWRLCPSTARLAWALYNDEVIRRQNVPTHLAKRMHRDDWVLNPLWDYLRHCGFVGPAGVRVARYRLSKYVVDVDFTGAYNAWLSSDPHPAQTIKELVCP